MRRILVTGASGQIGSELVPALRERYGDDDVVAVGHSAPLTPEVTQGGPCTWLDVTDADGLTRFTTWVRFFRCWRSRSGVLPLM